MSSRWPKEVQQWQNIGRYLLGKELVRYADDAILALKAMVRGLEDERDALIDALEEELEEKAGASDKEDAP